MLPKKYETKLGLYLNLKKTVTAFFFRFFLVTVLFREISFLRLTSCLPVGCIGTPAKHPEDTQGQLLLEKKLLEHLVLS